MRASALLFAALLGMAGCTQGLPDAQRTISSEALNAPYPELAPLDGLLARAEDGSRVEVETRRLEARVAGLKARARALRGRSVIDGASRLRLLEAAERNTTRLSG